MSAAPDLAARLPLGRDSTSLEIGPLVRTHLEALHAHPGVEPDFDQLLDAREVTKVELSGACLREVATDTVFGEGSLRVFVTGSEVGFGMARMYQMLRDESPDEIRIFRNIDEARAWLGLPVDD